MSSYAQIYWAFRKVDLAHEIQLASCIVTKTSVPWHQSQADYATDFLYYHNDITLVVGCTVDVERFAGLNVCGFNPTKVFVEILSCCLSQKCLLLKRGTYIHGKTFVVLLKTTKTMNVSSVNLSPFMATVTATAQPMLCECFQVLVCIGSYICNIISQLHLFGALLFFQLASQLNSNYVC